MTLIRKTRLMAFRTTTAAFTPGLPLKIARSA
jgi:hypothetical protein